MTYRGSMGTKHMQRTIKLRRGENYIDTYTHKEKILNENRALTNAYFLKVIGINMPSQGKTDFIP